MVDAALRMRSMLWAACSCASEFYATIPALIWGGLLLCQFWCNRCSLVGFGELQGTGWAALFLLYGIAGMVAWLTDRRPIRRAVMFLGALVWAAASSVLIMAHPTGAGWLLVVNAAAAVMACVQLRPGGPGCGRCHGFV